MTRPDIANAARAVARHSHVESDWQQDGVTIKQSAIIDTLTKSFSVTAQSDTPASTVADLGPTTADDTVVDCPFRQVVCGVMWLAEMTRQDIANAARAVACHSHVERDWQQDGVTIKQPAIIDTLTKSFSVTAQSDTPASTVAEEPRRAYLLDR